MPYTVEVVSGGYKVCKKAKPSECLSKKPLPKKRANAQRIAVLLSEMKLGKSKKNTYK